MKKNKEFWTKANRKTVVLRTDIFEELEGSFWRPKAEHLTDADAPDLRAAIVAGEPIWRLEIVYQEGLEEPNRFTVLCTSKEGADAYAASYQAGDEIKPLGFLFPTSPTFDARNLSKYTELCVLGRGEAPYGVLLDALVGSGVHSDYVHLSEEVMSWIGEAGEASLRDRFGDNWSAVAALEFCVVHFHETSLATLAARVQVADFVADGDYDAGYASREFEMLFTGAEQLAMQATSTRKLAGMEGGNASRRRRLANLEALINEVKLLSDAAGLISEDRIVSQAIEAVQKREPNMPKSKKTLEDYETALRSEEPFKARYDAVFHKNT